MAGFLVRSTFASYFLRNVRQLTKAMRLYSSDVRPRINVGTVGHIDHGKTTLTAAITKVLQQEGRAKFMKYDDIDRAPEEKARGITINVCHVGYSTAARDYSHTDCPGHIDYIKNMIVGTSQMDGAILVIAATDGTMPQTREHLMLAKQLGVQHIVVFINKADLVDRDTVELVQLEASELLEEIGYDSSNVPFVDGSALCALEDRNPSIGRDSIMRLLDIMDKYVIPPQRKIGGPFLMPIEKITSILGRGTVLIGTILEGTVSKGHSCVIQGYGQERKSVVTGIGMFDNLIDTAHAGDNVGLLLKSIKKDTIQRGMCVSHIDAGTKQHDSFRAQVYIRRKNEGGRVKPIVQKYINNMYMDTWDLSACMMLPENTNMVMPGDTIETVIHLRLPMVIREGQKFFIRDGPQTTINGVVLEPLPRSNLVIPGFNTRRGKTEVFVESNAQVVRKKRFEAMERAKNIPPRTKT